MLAVAGCSGARPVTTPAPAAVPGLRFGADTHLHFTMSQAAKPLFKGEAGSGFLAASPRSRLLNQVEADQLRAAGVKLAYAALWPPMRARPTRSSLEESLQQLRGLDDFVARRPDFAVVLTAAEARQAIATGRIALLPQVEGGEGIESVEDVDKLYAAGTRCVTVVHFISSQLGGAAVGQLAKNLFGADVAGKHNPEGLTELGKAVITRMMQLGIVIDVSHASDKLVEDVLALTEPRGVPIIVSHGGVRALMNMERNVSDAIAKRVTAGGGLVGVSVFDGQVETQPADYLSPQHQPGTCDDVVAHWKHLASVVPADQLVLGSDFNGFIVRPRAGGLCANGLRNAGDLNDLWAALVANGVPREALDGMGDKLLGVVEKVEKLADPAAQAEAMAWRAKVMKRRTALNAAQ